MAETTHDVEAIFLAALEQRTPERRVAYAEGACAGDPKTLERVKQLLAAHEQPAGPLDSPPLGPGNSPTLEQSVTEKPGTVIGHYRLMEQIGEGGFGLVFVAQQEYPVRRKVALKIIKPGMDSREVIARFSAEQQALAIMDHPNIARVFDAGVTETGRPFFVMELVKGIPIIEYCDQQRLNTRDRLELFRTLCHAVQHAHTKGVIHRDLKPSNVLVAPHDGAPIVKVIDFGIAKAIGQQLTDKTIYTRFAQMIGTPLYMSPEQAEINAMDVDIRSDVYSLGVLLYELLTGSTPFAQSRFSTAEFDEIRRIIKQEEPPKPSTRLSTLGKDMLQVSSNRNTDPARLTAAVKGDLDWIVMKALEKDRSRRYETASAFAADVQRYLAKEPVEARPPTFGYRAAKYLRRNRVPITVLGMLIASLTIGLAGTVWQAWDAAKYAQKAEENARRAEENALQANQAKEEAQSTLGKYRDELFERALWAAMSNDPSFEDRIHTAEDAGMPMLKKTLLLGLNALYSGRPDDAVFLLEEAVDLNHESVAANAALAIAHQHCGNFEAWLDSVIRIMDSAPRDAEDYLLKALAVTTVGDPDEALRLADQAITMSHSPLALATRAEIRAWVALDRNDFGLLMPALEDIRALRRTLPEPSAFVTNADLFIHLSALILSDPSHQKELAGQASDAVIQLAEKFPTYEFGRYHRANFFLLTGQDDLAEQEWQELLNLKRRPTWLIDYAQVLYRNGKYQEAKKILAELETSPQSLFGTYIACEGKKDLSRVLDQIKRFHVPRMEEFTLRSLTLLGAPRRAADLAREWLKTLPTPRGSWPRWEYSKLRYYAHPDFTRDDLLEAAGKSPFKRCDACCLLGVVALAGGDFGNADIYFQQAVDTRAVWFESYQMADAMLRRMRSTRGWPWWIKEGTNTSQ